MSKSFNLPTRFSPTAIRIRFGKDPRLAARVMLGLLLFINLIAAYCVMSPIGGSAEQLDARISALQQDIQTRNATLQRMRQLVGRMNQARSTGDEFLGQYFMDRRTASSTILSELDVSSKDAGMKPKERSFNYDPIEGTEQFSMMTVIANYEGTYGDLLQFVNKLDRSPRFLIIDTLVAAPQQGAQQGLLNVQIKFNTFVREGAARI